MRTITAPCKFAERQQAFAMDFSWSHNVTEPASAHFLIFNSILLSLNVLFGTSGNVLVCWSVLRNRSLRTANNTLLVNLTAVAFLKCSVDSPVFLASLIVGEMRVEVGLFLCCVQQFTYSLLSCAQFLTLVLISMERFQAIAFPFRNRNERIPIWILFIWVFGLFFAILSLTLCHDPLCYMMCQHLRNLPGSRPDPFGAYVLVPVWGVSLMLIIVYYFRIFSVVRLHTNKITDTGVQFTASLGRQQPRWDNVAHSAPWTADPRPQKPCSAQESAAFLPLDEFRSAGNNHSSPNIAGAVCILTPATRELGKKRLEGRVAKRSGYIIITVILFWSPLFVTLCLNMSEDFGQKHRWLLREFETCALVLTCVSAAVEPLVYALLQRQLRTQLYKLLPTRLRKTS